MRSILLVLALVPTAPAADPPRRPVEAEVGAYLQTITDVDLRAHTFRARFWIWFLEDEGWYRPDQSIEIANAVDQKVESVVRQEIGGRHWTQLRMLAVIRKDFRPSMFPFDGHDLEIQLEDSEEDTALVRFRPQHKAERPNIALSSDISLSDWIVRDARMEVVPKIYDTDFGDPRLAASSAYDRVVLHARIARRNPWRLFVSLLLGTFSAFAMATLALLIPPAANSPKIGIGASAIFVAIAAKLAIEAQIPPFYNALLLDGIQAFVFLFAVASLAWNVRAVRRYQRGS